jgi:hypothetical protein
MLRVRLVAIAGLTLVAALTAAQRAGATTFVINNLDAPGEGFNDPTPVAAVGGNGGTTLGAQRLNAFQAAANIWGASLDSSITISLDASMDPLPCNSNSAVLGSAGPTTISSDFSGAPLPDRWYPAALANSLASTDLVPTSADINVTFNSNLGQTNCLPGSGWYLGLDGNTGGLIDLVNVALHEFAHGLGFISFTDGVTGESILNIPDAFGHFMFDTGTGKHWDAMTDLERATSAQHARYVVWDGARATAGVTQHLAQGTPVLTVSTLPTELPVGLADFGPVLTSSPITGNVTLTADSGGLSTSDGCEALLTNLVGKIALIDRGNCFFADKVQHAQDAGAIAVLIADNVAGSPPAPLGFPPSGSPASIIIPSVRITLADGDALKGALNAGPVSATLVADPMHYVGADGAHRALLFTPQPLVSGSSLSHWDPLASPNLLMEPSITDNPTHSLDLTVPLMLDLGWHAAAVSAVPVTSRPMAVIGALGFLAVGLLATRRRTLR